MLKTLSPLKAGEKINLNAFWAILFCFLLIIGISKFLLFLENNLKPTQEVEAAPLSQELESNQMTKIIEDGYLK